MTTSRLAALVAVAAMLAPPAAATAAYPHQGEGDAATFTSAYPARAGTKLDSCALCHTGGTVTVGGKTTVMGSCQWRHATFEWARVRDPDPRAAVSYALEYTSGDPVKGPWTRVSVTPEPRRAPEGKGGALLALLLGDLVRPGCVDGRGDDDPRTWFGWGATARETVRLERHTTYHWRVIADGPASHNVSAVRSFTTGP